MENIELYIFLFIIPGVLGNVSHMFVVKKDFLNILAVPVSEKYFGPNKTWRGFVFLPLIMGFIILVENVFRGPFSAGLAQDLLAGVGLGLAYMISELPNSFVKRRLGIEAGGRGQKFKTLQLLIDKTDSLFGACVFFGLFLRLPFFELVWLFFFSLILHLLISALLYVLKIKKSI